MDTFAHALYGMTVCSRRGLAGGAKGSTGTTDWTVWVALVFGVLPDVVSMGILYLAFWLGDAPAHFFRDFGGRPLLVYRYMHSLLVALAVCGLLRLVWRPMAVPALAWPLHLCMDAFTHGAGKFQTMIFYPLSTWAVDGIRWWHHSEVVLAYWLALPVTWWCLWYWRRTITRRIGDATERTRDEYS